jgi:hypothetical protein
VLVRCYHGLGDTLQFVRFVPRLAGEASSVVLWTQPALIELLEGLCPAIELLPLHDGVPSTPFDVDVEIMELPHVFRTTVHTIPSAVPYLRLPARAPRDLATVPVRPSVGVVWRGGGWDARRSVPFARLAPLLARQDIELVPLQDALTADEALCLPGWRRCSPPSRLAETIVGLDLVVTVDTMAAHLAGALAAPTWLLLHHDADWRWMLDRDDTPWYPTMRLYRLREGQDWDVAIARVMRDLDAFVRCWHDGSCIRRPPLAPAVGETKGPAIARQRDCSSGCP